MRRHDSHRNGVRREPPPRHDLLDHFGVTSRPGWPDRFGRALAAWAVALPPVRTLSLFSGAGGLDIGFAQAGFDIRTAVEHDAACARTLEANSGAGRMFPFLKVVGGDVTEFRPATGEGYDLVIGCPPCQSYSAAGRRANGANGRDDRRGTLFRAYIRLLRAVRPRAFVFENVPGMIGANGGRAWAEILREFAAAGYGTTHRTLDAADYGVPQHRERVILIGVRDDLAIPFRFPTPTHGPDSPRGRPHFTAAGAVRGADVTDDELGVRLGGRYGHLLAAIPPGLNYAFYTARLGHPNPVFAWRSKFSDFLYKADPDAPVRTLKADEGGYTGPFHWDARPFSLAEKKRLQTVPDSYALCGNRTEVNAQIGNAVPCQLARVLAVAVRTQLFGTSPPFDLPTLDDHAVLGFRARKRLLTKRYEERAAVGHTGLSTAVPRSRGRRAQRYLARWSNDFRLTEDASATDGLWVMVDHKAGRCRVEVTRYEAAEPSAFTVHLIPREGTGWPRGLTAIELAGAELEGMVFAALWRALDRELVCRYGYADLVQLNGYYQHPPRVACRLTFRDGTRPDTHWRCLARVVAGDGVGQTASTKHLAKDWQIEPRNVRPFAAFLRTLGYEVRNRNTNPQIAPGHWLVPYPFPTLTPASVQRHKSL